MPTQGATTPATRVAVRGRGPDRPAHLLEWLGLEDAGQFDASAFEIEDVNAAL
ncbi:hypothetical protein BH20ACT16_BH20ACT16_13850 [soil metagenome]|jgi:hypothetical protein